MFCFVQIPRAAFSRAHPRSAMQSASDSDAPIKSAGAAAESNRGCLLQSLHAHFPDARTRYSFIIALLLALAASVYWLVDTIQSKWLYDISHPVQAVSFDTVSRLPALSGMIFFLDHAPLWSDNVTLLHRVIPSHFNDPNNQPNIQCDDYPYYPPFVMCQQTQDNGQPVMNPASAPPGELSGASARSFDETTFPLQFVDGVDIAPSTHDVVGLCYESHLILNSSAALQMQYYDTPELLVGWLTPHGLLALNELAAAGRTDSADPAMQRIIDASGNSFNQRVMTMLDYNSISSVVFEATRFIGIDGTSLLEFDFSKIRSHPRTHPQLVEQNFQMLLNLTDDPAERQRLIALRADPTVSYQMSIMCMQPSSFVVKEARAVRLYGLGSFLSDLGGFVNLLTIALLILFPLTLKVTQPRSVLPLWILERWKSGKVQQRAIDADTAGLADIGMQDLTSSPLSDADVPPAH